MKDYRNEIISHIEECVGVKSSIVKKIAGKNGKLEFEVAIFRANESRPYHIVSTIGLSNYKMAGKSKFAEIIFYLDKSWNLFSEEEKYSWVYDMVQDVYTSFYNSGRKLEFGQTFFTEGSNTFSPSTEMNTAILYYPVGFNSKAWSIRFGMFKKIDFFLITTATYKEYTMVRRNGGLSFVSDYLLEDGDLENLAIYNKR